MSAILKLIGFCLLLIISLIGILFFRAEIYFPYPKNIKICNETHEPIKGDDIVNRFAEALKIPTITSDRHKYDTEQLIKFAQFLRKSFPEIYSSRLIEHEVINNYSLLYHVKGSDPTLKPYLLCSHIDVVPVERQFWDVDPFGGIIKDGIIYGRGAIDVKDTLMAIMESLTYLLKNNFKPKRSFYIAFGHDEEGMGMDGASEIAKTFKRKGIKEFEFLLDEGTMVFRDGFPGVTQNVALLSVSEKGFLTVKLKAKADVGHSSIPSEETSVTILAKAVSKFTSKVHQSFFGQGPERRMFEEFATFAEYPYKLIYSNLWLFSPIISRMITAKTTGNALVRTTSAATVIKGGFKENVLPSETEALINHRIHPQQSVDDILKIDKQIIDDDRVDISAYGDTIEPHPISPYDYKSFGFETLKKSILQVFTDTIVIPGIMIATTDTRWYLPFTKSVYRFSPALLFQNETKLFHGHNERISVDNYLKVVNFYHHVIVNSDRDKLEDPKFKDEL